MKQILSRQARADKKVRDLAAANTRNREIKRAENQTGVGTKSQKGESKSKNK